MDSQEQYDLLKKAGRDHCHICGTKRFGAFLMDENGVTCDRCKKTGHTCRDVPYMNPVSMMIWVMSNCNYRNPLKCPQKTFTLLLVAMFGGMVGMWFGEKTDLPFWRAMGFTVILNILLETAFYMVKVFINLFVAFKEKREADLALAEWYEHKKKAESPQQDAGIIRNLDLHRDCGQCYMEPGLSTSEVRLRVEKRR